MKDLYPTEIECRRIALAIGHDPSGAFSERNRHLVMMDTERLHRLREAAAEEGNARLIRRINEVIQIRAEENWP